MPTFVPPGYTIPLEDIRDMQGWVRSRVERFFANGSPTAAEVEETCSQGVLILLELHERWDQERSPRFSAYAISLFGKRLIDYWRGELARSGRGHTPQTKEGKRLPTVYHGMVSLDALAPGEAAPSETFAATRGGGLDSSLVHFDTVSE